MGVNEVRIKVMPSDKNSFAPLAYGNVKIDDLDLVVRDIKILNVPDRDSGAIKHLISMPSRRIMDHCPTCGEKNHLMANFCNECGDELSPPDNCERSKRFSDLVFPSSRTGRACLERALLDAYRAACAKNIANAIATIGSEGTTTSLSALGPYDM